MTSPVGSTVNEIVEQATAVSAYTKEVFAEMISRRLKYASGLAPYSQH